MDTLTHGLLGALTAQAGFRQRLGRGATWAAAAAAVLADLDMLASPVARLLGMSLAPFSALAIHRGITHSLLAAPVLALPVAAAWRWLAPRRRPPAPPAQPTPAEHPEVTIARLTAPPPTEGPKPRFALMYACCLLAALCHGLLDWCNSYGTQLLAPFRHERYALDAVAIVDLIYTPLLAMSLLACWALRKALRGGPRASVAAGVIALLLSSGYLAAGWLAGRHVIALARQALPPGLNALDIRAYPAPGSIFLWRVTVRAEDQWLLARARPWYSPQQIASSWRRAPSARNAWTQKAANLPAAKTLEWFALGNVRATFRTDKGLPVVELHDMRFGIPPDSTESLWVLQVTFTPRGAVREAKMAHQVRPGGIGPFIRQAWADLWQP